MVRRLLGQFLVRLGDAISRRGERLAAYETPGLVEEPGFPTAFEEATLTPEGRAMLEAKPRYETLPPPPAPIKGSAAERVARARDRRS